MKRNLLTALALTCMLTASAQWVQPTVGATTDLVAGDTVYLYNTEAKLFLTQGNASGTQASVDAEGLKIVVDKYVPTTVDSETGEKLLGEWDGKTYTIMDFRPIQQKWFYMFIDSKDYGFNSYGGCFMDRASQENYLWEFDKQDDGTYLIHGASANPTYNQENYPNCYLGVVKDEGKLNTAVFPLIDITSPLEECEYYMHWSVVARDVYEKYYSDLTLYNAAQALKSSIDDLQSRGIDVASLLSVYDDTSSTIEQINEAQIQANQLISQDDEKNVTPDNPKDFTSAIKNPNFDSGVSSWTKSGSATTFEANGWVPATEEDVMVAPALNLWAANQDILVEQTVVDIPNGIYKFSCGVFSQANGPFVFANDTKAAVTTGGPVQYNILTYVQDNTINIGLGFPAEGTQWVMADCFRLKYFGNGYDAYKMWIDETLASSSIYDESTRCNKQLYNDYAAALNALTSAGTQEEIVAALPSFLSLADSLKENAAAYAAYEKLVNEVIEMSLGGSYAGEDFDFLCDYSAMEADPSDEFPNGSAPYILNQGMLTTEEVILETAFLDSLMKLAVTTSMAPGADATTLLANPNFDSAFDGWTYNKKLGVPSPGGLETNPNVERWNQNFDFYQEISLPNGVYRVDAQAFYRSASNSVANPVYTAGEDEVLTFLYANTNEVAVKNIYSEAQDLGFYKESSAYVMNDGEKEVPNTMKTASEAFSAGLYENSVYGVAYNGKLRVGVRSLTASNTDRWSIWDNFRITFVGFDADVINECYNQSVAEAEALLAQDLTDELLGELQLALSAEIDENDGRSTIPVIAAIREAMENANTYLTGIQIVETPRNQPSVSAIYTINGQKVSSMQRGVNIVRLSNGMTKKIIITK